MSAALGGGSARATPAPSGPGAPASISAVSGDGQTTAAGLPFPEPLVVIVRDEGGLPVPGITVYWSAAEEPITFGSVTSTTGSDGIALVPVTSTGSADAAIAAFATIEELPEAMAEFDLVVEPGPLHHLVMLTDPEGAEVGAAFLDDVYVSARDEYDNGIAGILIAFTAPTSGPSAVLDRASDTTNASGTASTVVTAGTIAGEYTVTASFVGLDPVTVALTNTPGAAASIAVVSGAPQATLSACTFADPLVAVVKDEYDNPIPGVSVTFTPPVSGASVAISGTTTTDANGQVSVTATANGLYGAAYVVSASVSGVVATADYSLTNVDPLYCIDSRPEQNDYGTGFTSGTKFYVARSGISCAGVKFRFLGAGESVVCKLWRVADSTCLASKTITAATGVNVATATFDSAVALTSGAENLYVATINRVVVSSAALSPPASPLGGIYKPTEGDYDTGDIMPATAWNPGLLWPPVDPVLTG